MIEAELLPQVKVEYPLKQGLKHSNTNLSSLIYTKVKVEYPLKQGLKLSQLSPSLQDSIRLK